VVVPVRCAGRGSTDAVVPEVNLGVNVFPEQESSVLDNIIDVNIGAEIRPDYGAGGSEKWAVFGQSFDVYLEVVGADYTGYLTIVIYLTD
jgi:hypothetical protein